MEASIIQANGRRFLLAYLQPGDIGGLISLLDRLPLIGDRLHWQGWSLTVVEVKERRVTRVLMRQDAETAQ